MAEPFLSEIRIMSFVFAPEGLGSVRRAAVADQSEPGAFLVCWGRRSAATGESISRCPICAGATPIHVGSGHTLGERGGEQAHTLSLAELPAHTHALQATSVAGLDQSPTPVQLLATGGTADHPWGPSSNLVAMAPRTIAQFRRVAGSPEHAAVLDPELLHCPAGHFPQPN